MKQNSGRHSSPHHEIGGPLLWLGLACALANGLCSQPVVDKALSRLHLDTLQEADPESGEAISSLVIIAGAGGLFFPIHLFLSRLCRGHADLARWKRLVLLTYVCSLSWEILLVVVSIFFRDGREPPMAVMLVILFFTSFGIGSFLFAVKNPADGFFCVGISLLMLEQFTDVVTRIRVESVYFSGATMGLIFAYIYGHAWSRRFLGLVAVAPIALCVYSQRGNEPVIMGIFLLYGAVPGSLVWVIRWGLWRRRARFTPNPLPAPQGEETEDDLGKETDAEDLEET